LYLEIAVRLHSTIRLHPFELIFMLSTHNTMAATNLEASFQRLSVTRGNEENEDPKVPDAPTRDVVTLLN
jgi:hypothetical protein